MLEKITETLVVSEFYELNNKKDKLVKLFFLDYIKSLPYYYKYSIVTSIYKYLLQNNLFKDISYIIYNTVPQIYIQIFGQIQQIGPMIGPLQIV